LIERDQERRVAIARNAAQLDGDALEILERIAARLVEGRRRYGHLELDTTPRDFVDEALDEQLDAVFYVTGELLRISRIPRTERGRNADV